MQLFCERASAFAYWPLSPVACCLSRFPLSLSSFPPPALWVCSQVARSASPASHASRSSGKCAPLAAAAVGFLGRPLAVAVGAARQSRCRRRRRRSFVKSNHRIFVLAARAESRSLSALQIALGSWLSAYCALRIKQPARLHFLLMFFHGKPPAQAGGPRLPLAR